MPELDELIKDVADDLTAVRWTPAAELRALVRRRRQRSVAAAVALVTALTAGTASLVARPGGDAAPPPSATRSATAPDPAIPPDAMLRPADVGGGPDPEDATDDAFQPIQLDPMLELCVRERRPELLTQRASNTRSQSHTLGTGDSRAYRPFVLTQTVYRMSAPDAEVVFRDLRAAAEACAGVTYTGDMERPGQTKVRASGSHTWTIVASGFAGDDSLILRHHVTVRNADTGALISDSDAGLDAYVRVGDLVTHIVPRSDAEAEELRRVATSSAGRLCTAAFPTC